MWRPSGLAASFLALACQTVQTQPFDAHGGGSTVNGSKAALNETEAPRFYGACDASGAVALSDRLFAVADDEDNVIRVYDANRGGAPMFAVDLSSELGVKGKKRRKKAPETDIEAATRVGDLAFWLTSHGRSSKGKLQAERFRFFATTTVVHPSELKLVGKGYHRLLHDLLADPRLAAYELARAAERGPQEAGGLNIEGMTARTEGGVWVGFRNPTPNGRALLVPLLNPERVVHGEPAVFGDPLLLDLGGLGVRGLSWWRDRYLVIAGHYAAAAESQLFSWDGASRLQRVPVSLAGFNPEGFFTPETRDRILLLSDDGSQPVGGKECKRVRDPAAKSFRGRWVGLE